MTIIVISTGGIDSGPIPPDEKIPLQPSLALLSRRIFRTIKTAPQEIIHLDRANRTRSRASFKRTGKKKLPVMWPYRIDQSRPVLRLIDADVRSNVPQSNTFIPKVVRLQTELLPDDCVFNVMNGITGKRHENKLQ